MGRREKKKKKKTKKQLIFTSRFLIKQPLERYMLFPTYSLRFHLFFHVHFPTLLSEKVFFAKKTGKNQVHEGSVLIMNQRALFLHITFSAFIYGNTAFILAYNGLPFPVTASQPGVAGNPSDPKHPWLDPSVISLRA
jgi:hypothetical protein